MYCGPTLFSSTVPFAMFSRIHHVSANSWKYFKREGTRGFLIRLAKEVPYRLSRCRSWFRNQLVGQFVEVCGNKWKLDGLTYSFDTPAISRTVKSRFVWGTYEDKERRLVEQHVPADLPVIEGGGSIGVISNVINRKLSHPENHIVIEANPDLLPVLEANRTLNDAKYEIVHAALDPNGPEVTFYLHKLSVGGSVQRATGSAVTVPAVTVGGLIKEKGWDKVSLVIDIEGGELDLIEKEQEVLKNHVAVFIVEVHHMISDAQDIKKAIQTIERLGFTFKEEQTDVYVYYNENLL